MSTPSIELATGYVSLLVSTKDMGRQIARGFKGADSAGEKAGKSAGKRMGIGLGTSIKAVLGSALILGAVAKTLSLVGDSIAEAREAQKVGATTTQIIKATGGAAKVSAAQIGSLAEAISVKTGVDDEAIQKGANLLLTFKNVRNEAGKGSAVFDRATKAAVDLSAAGFGSIEGASKMLGKALNDPVKGISALSRAGVTFTDQQKEQIKTLVKSGDTLGAQKIIMGEVESQVGGVAAASATMGEKLTVAFGNFQERIGTAFLPLVDRIGDALLKTAIPAMNRFADFIGAKIVPGIQGLYDLVIKGDFTAALRKAFGWEEGSRAVDYILELRGGVKAFFAAMKAGDGEITSSGFPGFMERLGFLASNLRSVFARIGPALTPVFTILRNLLPQLKPLVPEFAALGRVIGGALMTALPVVGQALATVGRIIGQVLVAVLPPVVRFIRNDFVPALGGIVAAGQRLGAVVLPILKAVVGEFMRNWPVIEPIVVGIFQTLRGIVLDVMGLVQNIISRVTKSINAIWSRWGAQITALTGSALRTVVSILGGAFKTIGGLVKVITGLMTGDWRKMGEGFKLIGRGLVQVVVALFRNMMTTLDVLLKDTVQRLVTKWVGFLAFTRGRLRAGLSAVTDFVLAPVRAARDALKGILDQITSRFSSGVDAIGRAWDGLKEKAKAPIRFVINTVINDGLIGAFNKVAAVIPGVGPLSRVSVPGFHDGGWTGPGARLKPAGVVHADEFVINKSSRRKIERDSPGLLNRLNGYAQGGLVGGSGRFSPLFESRLVAASRMAGTVFRIFQRGFRPATSYSGTSHAGDAVDLAPITSGVIRALRAVGIAAWDRTGKGNWAPHIHGVPLPGSGFGAGSAVWQAQDYLRGGDGLGGRDNGPRVGVLGKIGAFVKSGLTSIADWFKNLIKDPLRKLGSITSSPLGQLAAGVPRALVEGMTKRVSKFDSGGTLRPGLTMAYNGTGRNERVLTAPQWDAMGKGTGNADALAAATFDQAALVAAFRTALEEMLTPLDERGEYALVTRAQAFGRARGGRG